MFISVIHNCKCIICPFLPKASQILKIPKPSRWMRFSLRNYGKKPPVLQMFIMSYCHYLMFWFLRKCEFVPVIHIVGSWPLETFHNNIHFYNVLSNLVLCVFWKTCAVCSSCKMFIYQIYILHVYCIVSKQEIRYELSFNPTVFMNSFTHAHSSSTDIELLEQGMVRNMSFYSSSGALS